MGGCAIGEVLLVAGGIREYEQIEIYNVTNGEHLATHAIRAQSRAAINSVNGAAARKAMLGDRLVNCIYGKLSEAELRFVKPHVAYADARNRIVTERYAAPPLKAAACWRPRRTMAGIEARHRSPHRAGN